MRKSTVLYMKDILTELNISLQERIYVSTKLLGSLYNQSCSRYKATVFLKILNRKLQSDSSDLFYTATLDRA